MEQAPTKIAQNESTRRKILYVITKSNFGGAQRYVYDMATSLPKDQFDVTVAFGGTGEVNSTPGILSDMLSAVGVRTIYIPELSRDIKTKRDKDAFRALRNLFAEERPDIVHLNSSKAAGLGALAARLERVPKIIFTVHGWPFWEKRSFLQRFSIFILSWLTVSLSHKTITISKNDRRALQFIPFVNNKIVTIYNGIRPIAALDKESARSALFDEKVEKEHAGDLWILSIAELTKNKNLLRSIEAVAQYNKTRTEHEPSAFYTIIGDGEMRDSISKYISKNFLSESVKLLGFIPDTRRYLSGFDILLLPSIKEGVPYVILEAASGNLTVAASAVGGIPEVIKSGESGILIKNPNNTQDIVDAIRDLSSEDYRKRLSRALLETVEQNHSFERMRGQTIELY